MSGQFPPNKLSVAILSRLCYLQRRLTGLHRTQIKETVGDKGRDGGTTLNKYWINENGHHHAQYRQRIGLRPAVDRERLKSRRSRGGGGG